MGQWFIQIIVPNVNKYFFLTTHQTPGDYTALHQRRCNVLTLHRR